MKRAFQHIIDWAVVVVYGSRWRSAISYCPVFAELLGHQIKMMMLAQVAGKFRRARLCSSSQALQPF